jgi:hypothetical protein
LEAIGTIPIGYPEKDVGARYRRPLDQLVHWNSYQLRQHRPDDMVRFYVDDLRPFAMYRGQENLIDWPDADAKLGPWKAAFTGPAPGEGGPTVGGKGTPAGSARTSRSPKRC